VLGYQPGSHLLQIEQHTWPLASHALGPDRFDLTLGEQRLTVAVYRNGDRFDVFAPQGRVKVLCIDPMVHPGDANTDPGGLTALMPGKVVALHVKAGQAVKKGQALAVTEAMKMEHTLCAPQDGVVAELLCAVGDQVAEGSALIKLK
jgi:3-methylcrotonyl-CoA carboxylase alpha subunit